MYKVFTRTWWKDNPRWPNGLEPYAGKKTYIKGKFTEEEAIELCQHWNSKNKAGRYSLKAEFEEA